MTSIKQKLTDQPLPDFSGEKAGKVVTEGTRVEVVFPSGAVPAARDLALRVSLPDAGDAKLYALYLAGE